MTSRAFWRSIIRFLPVIALLLASVAFVVVQAPRTTELSMFDEYVYLDYLAKIPIAGVVPQGDVVGELARAEISCRGVLNYGTFGENCGLGPWDDLSLFPYGGATGADIYSPLYFAITWVLAQPLTWFGLSLLEAGRLVGAVWLSAGTGLLYCALRQLKVSKQLALALGLLVLATPAIYWSSLFLSTDAPTLAVGSGLSVMGVLVSRRRLSAWWLAPAFAVAVLFKVQNIATVGVVALVLVVYELLRWRMIQRGELEGQDRPGSGPTGMVLAVASAVAGALAAQVGWLGLRRFMSVQAVPREPVDAAVVGFRAILGEAVKFVLNVGGVGVAQPIWQTFAVFVLTASVLLALPFLLFARSSSLAERTMAGSVGGMALLMGPALALASMVVAGYYFVLPVRYGIALLAVLVICLGVLYRRFGWAHGPLLGGSAVLALMAIIG